jgi:aminoglycoside phosphotransferase (APT) family kinase protein
MLTIDKLDKDNPSPEWIQDLRQRFPVEREMDRVLTRKLQQRSGPGYAPVSLETLCNGLRSLLLTELTDPFEIRDAKWLSGGASKLQVSLKLDWHPPGCNRTVTPMVIRMEPAESIVETSRLREFQVIKAVSGILPVPQVYWIDEDGKHFPYPAIVYGFADGVAKPTGTLSNVTGLGTNYGPGLRAVLGKQYVEHLALLHTWDWSKADLSAFDVPAIGKAAIELQLNWWERVWEEDSNRDIPLMRVAAAWLRENMPEADRLSMIHGDYRAGNFLFTEHDQRISAWLDWELAHLGDFHEDLAYTTLPFLGHQSEDSAHMLASGMMPTKELYERYENATSFTVDMKKIDYYHIFHAWRSVVIVIGSGYRPARNGKTHQDLLLNWIMGVGYTILDFLGTKLEEIA